MRPHLAATAFAALLLVARVPTSTAAETVELKFAWPEGVVADVQFTASRKRVAGDRRMERSVTGQYILRTRRVEDGLLLEHSEVEVETAKIGNGGDEQAQEKVQAFLSKVGSVLPNYVVDDSGRFLRVDGVEALQSSFAAAIEEMLAEQPAEFRERLRAAINRALSVPQLESGVKGHWSRDVGGWAGRDMEVGKVYGVQAQSAVALLSGARIPTQVDFTLVERRPCGDQQGEPACVMLEMRALVSGESAQAMAEQISAQLSGRSGRKLEVGDFEVDNRVRVLTEPETLLPHEVEFLRVTSMSITADGGEPTRNSQSEQRQTRYRYR